MLRDHRPESQSLLQGSGAARKAALAASTTGVTVFTVTVLTVGITALIGTSFVISAVVGTGITGWGRLGLQHCGRVDFLYWRFWDRYECWH